MSEAVQRYYEALTALKKDENEAIAIQLKAFALADAAGAPPEELAVLAEITGDENDHDMIYTALIEKYAKELGNG